MPRLQSSAPACVGQHSLNVAQRGAALGCGRSVAKALRLSAIRWSCDGGTQFKPAVRFMSLAACKTLAFPSLLPKIKRSGAKRGARVINALSNRPKPPPQRSLLVCVAYAAHNSYPAP